jgi:hypothetical protein
VLVEWSLPDEDGYYRREKVMTDFGTPHNEKDD